MAIIRLQGEQEKRQGVYYEFDTQVKPLGEGGMGKVYRGRRINMHTSEIRDVAIKFLFNNLPPDTITRAENEANIRIRHENLIEMMGFLAVENKKPNGTSSIRYHVVSELLLGVSLSDFLQGILTDQMGNNIQYAQSLYNKYNTDPCQFAVTIVKKILSGVISLHDAGYIHRDIDPSNIMITQDCKVKLIDFGIAKQVSTLNTSDRNLTTAGQFIGKPQYAAPELCLGDVRNHNKPTDIYAVGILLFQLIVGHLPFEGSSMAIQYAQVHNKMPLNLIKDKGLRKIIAKATEKDCCKRYQSAAEFRAVLDNWKPGNSPVPGIHPDIRILRIAGAAIGAIILTLAIIFIIHENNPEPDPDPDPVQDIINQETAKNSSDFVTDPVTKIREQLGDPARAEKAYHELQLMVDKKDIEAMFIMSRLYAVQDGAFTLPDEYIGMQENLKLKGIIEPNPKKAHELLIEIVEIDPKNYKAEYELGCDYWVGPALTGGGKETRNLRLAHEYLQRAYDDASNAKDRVYIGKISALLDKF